MVMEDLLVHSEKQRAVVRAKVGKETELEMFRRFFPLNKNIPYSVAILQSVRRWNQYKMQARLVFKNRKADGDNHSPEWWANASASDIRPDLHQRVIVVDLPVEQTVVESALYSCRKCKSRLVTYYELQTRSADEPATAFFTCHKCKNRWRI
jgi:DNA-directed RNA polymerase subunit M/transcription elongation factor TFIIS